MATRRRDINTDDDETFNKLSTHTTQQDTGVNRQRVSTLYLRRSNIKQSVIQLIKYNILYYTVITLYIIYTTLYKYYNVFILEPINHSLVLTLCFIFTTYTLYTYRCNISTLGLYAAYILYSALYLVAYDYTQINTLVNKNPSIPSYLYIIPPLIHALGTILHSIAFIYLYILRQLNAPVITTAQSTAAATTVNKNNNRRKK